MVNTRAKTKKTLKACVSQASMVDSDHQSAALVESNDDLLIEILLWLPVASILRFKAVCKHWRCLLSDRRFTLLYDNLSKSPGLFVEDVYVPFDVENPSTPPFPSLDLNFDRCDVEIVQSCNGLLLCSSDIDNRGACKYYVFNPTTKQLALIPPISGVICFMGLAFHPTDCVHYKVICILSVGSGGHLFQIQIYLSETKKWKISIQSFSAFNPCFRHGVYWNGAVYWAPSYFGRSHLYFKIDVEQLQTLPLPVGLTSSETMAMYFGESRGHLHLIADKNRQENRLSLNVYEVLSDHSGWFVKYQLQLDELLGSFPEMISEYACYFDVVDVVRGEKEEDTFIVLNTSKKIITYNVYEKSFKQIFSCTSYLGSSAFHRYTETLSSF